MRRLDGIIGREQAIGQREAFEVLDPWRYRRPEDVFEFIMETRQ